MESFTIRMHLRANADAILSVPAQTILAVDLGKDKIVRHGKQTIFVSALARIALIFQEFHESDAGAFSDTTMEIC